MVKYLEQSGQSYAATATATLNFINADILAYDDDDAYEQVVNSLHDYLGEMLPEAIVLKIEATVMREEEPDGEEETA